MRGKGFTLIEVLIALAIFAIIATVTSLTLLNIFNTRNTVMSHANSLASLQTCYHLLRQDLSMPAKRFFYDQNHQKLGVFIGELNGFTFTRRANFTETGPNLQKISYAYKDKQLWRHTWSNESKLLYSQLLLQSIDQIQLRYIDNNHFSRDKWYTPNQDLLPVGLVLIVTLENAGTLEWTIKIPNDIKYEAKKAT